MRKISSQKRKAIERSGSFGHAATIAARSGGRGSLLAIG
jgi:hypothetical protein